MLKPFISTLAALTISVNPCVSAQAADANSQPPLLSLSAEASLKTAPDEMLATLAVVREGTQLGALNQAVLAELQQALAQARAVPSVTPRLGTVSAQQTYQQNKPSGWQVRGEIALESRQFPELGNLLGQLSQRMALQGVSFRVSTQRRAQVEDELIAAAAQAFRRKAETASRVLGFGGYDLRDMTLNPVSASGEAPRPMLMTRAAPAMGAAMPVPTDAGEVELTVNLTGQIALR
jgi:predicted secreted protein